jgi:hypothetical protein
MKLLNYLLHPLEGNDGKLSLRSIMAVAFLLGCIRYIERMGCDVSGDVLMVFGVIIGGFCGLKTWQNIKEKQISSNG